MKDNLPWLVVDVVKKEEERTKADSHAPVSQEFVAHAPQIIEELFRTYMNNTVLNMHLSSTSSISNMQYQLYLKMKNDPKSSPHIQRPQLLKNPVLMHHNHRYKSIMTQEVDEDKDIFEEATTKFLTEIQVPFEKANVVADALSRKERLKPRRVRAMSMTIQSGLKAKILEAQGEAFKDLKAPAEWLRGLERHFEKRDDRGVYFFNRVWIPSVGDSKDIQCAGFDHDHYQEAACAHHEEHVMHDCVQLDHVVDSHNDYTSDSNIILCDQYVRGNEVPVIHSGASSVPIDAFMT
nr:putative reverse transcriptase domain-containing protein [Tanacetum cinerariifolium]